MAKGLFDVLVRREEGAVEHAVDVQAVRTQPAIAFPMEAGGRRRGEKEVRLAVHPVSSFSLPGRVMWVRNISRNSSRSVILQLHILEDALQDGQLVVAQGDAPCPCGCRPGTSRGCRTWVRLRSS